MPDELPPLPPLGPPPAPKPGLFGAKPKDLPPPMDFTGIQKDINTLNTRLRVGEERYADLRAKLQLLEQNMLSHQKKLSQDMKNFNAEFMEIKRTLGEVENKIILLIKEIQLTAKKEDVDVLKRYVELWEPAKFATVNLVEKIVKEELDKHTDEEEH